MKDVTQLVKEAAAAAKHAPKHLQEMAFSKAYDTLVLAQHRPPTTGDQARTSAAKKSHRQKDRESHKTGNTLDDIDRAAHPEIRHDDTAVNNSLRLLRAAKDDLGIDGVTATEIGRILTDKFRCRTSRRTVSKALNGAGRYVNRHEEGRRAVFRIMAPGEDYLESLDIGEEKEQQRKVSKGSHGEKKSPVSRTAIKRTKGKRRRSHPAGTLAVAGLADLRR